MPTKRSRDVGSCRRPVGRGAMLFLAVLTTAAVALTATAQGPGPNAQGIQEPVSSALQGRDIRVPNTDQSVDNETLATVKGEIVLQEAATTTGLTGHPISRVSSPNDDMRLALLDILTQARLRDTASMRAAAQELMDILMGETTGRIYDGFAMLNFNRGAYAPGHMPGEYKMKQVRDTGETFTCPFTGETRRVWEADVSMLYYDGQIDSDTFLLRFPIDVHPDDTVNINYRIYSLVEEDFSPTLVMLDRREAANTVQFPYEGFDAVWIAFDPGQVLNVTVKYPPARMMRGVYTWGWRVHPPRIQFLQPVYEITNVHTGEVELDPQGKSFAIRNRENLTIDAISDAAPEKKMYTVAKAVLDGTDPATIERWLTQDDEGPRGSWFAWADLAKVQTQLPPEAWEILAQEGITASDFGGYNMISVYMNNEMYGEGPFQNEIAQWVQGETFKVVLINLDNHTHYFRNVDFGSRLNDDIQKCCGGGDTSFEIMNFKPSYGAPKVAEMQWRAGWGFRPHHDVIQQATVFARGNDRVRIAPYTGGFGDTYYGYQYSKTARGGDFRFNPPSFIIDDNDPPFPLRDYDGEAGLVIGQFTEGYGTGQMCPEDDYPGFCQTDISAYNPYNARNFPAPNDPTVPKTELRFPPFLRNPAQGQAGAGDIIPPTGAWRPFLWINPNNGTLFIDPEDPSKGYWADLTYSHGAPVFAGEALHATIELPRSAGQVFYQFDDLFHDNSIFSPHPVANPIGTLEDTDTVAIRRVLQYNGALRVSGELSRLSHGEYAAWVTVYGGAADASGCTGTVLGTAQVNGSGRFVFRKADTSLPSGTSVCVQSPVSGFKAAAVP